MQPPLTIVLAGTFVLLAVTNCYLMLRRPGKSTLLTGGRVASAHRFIGYLFTFLYCAMMYSMVLRLKGVSEELPARDLIHALLGLTLLPLLAAKIVIVRYYKTQTVVLKLLGGLIAGISFLVVAFSAGAYLLRGASATTISETVSGAVIFAFALVFGALFWRRPRATAGITSVRAGEVASETKPLFLQLTRVQRQTHDARTLRFMVQQGHVASFRPGQFLTFKWVIDGKTVPRCYSICSAPTQTGYIEITPKEVKGGHVSVFLNQRARVGLTVEASQPAGRFCFDETEHQRIVLIARGSGITPLISMLRYIDDRSLSTEVTLLYFVRTRQDVIFELELKLLQQRLHQFHFLIVLTEPDLRWTGATGHLTRELVEINVEDVSSSTFFLCGPAAMMKAARDLLESMGVQSDRIKQESFAARQRVIEADPGSVLPMARIEFARSKQVRMGPLSATILETAEACGIKMPYSCRQGQCGTCKTKLVSGKVRMDVEDGLTTRDKENNCILPCVSHAEGDVTLDA